MIRELPTPLTQTSAPREIGRLCQQFIDVIKEETEPHPLIVREAFELLATKLSGTHPRFDVSLGSIQTYSAVVTTEPSESLDQLQLDERKCLVLFH
jgi:hypothetical protein